MKKRKTSCRRTRTGKKKCECCMKGKNKCEVCGTPMKLTCPKEWTIEKDLAFMGGEVWGKAMVKKELEDLQGAYDIAIKEINLLREKLGYNKKIKNAMEKLK